MAVTANREIFKCEVCGNEVVVTKVGGGTLVCCGKDMTLVDEKNDVQTEDPEEDDEEE